MEESQMGLFGEEIPAPQASPVPVPLAPAREGRPAPARTGSAADNGKTPAARAEAAPAKAASAQVKKAAGQPAVPVKKRLKSAQVEEGKKISGLVPAGDVRLTANIREDLHLKLKIASACRRTTIGEILEELIEKHI
ncbi:hypothetical protein [Geomonas sp.]|uniref:hypothetical protein n=1 Tax=Geomonas sp. TaxID=2651584 RepID=UPI002B46CFA1|nr:hypothetical protein [Geomonas sp.]HJV33938.1 hypothetical protein [Geomonas sp.]